MKIKQKMSCNPFNKGHNVWDGSFNRLNIVIKDGSSLPYVAINESRRVHNVFKVDSGILSVVQGRKSCDFILLLCPTGQKNDTGKLYFIECKSSANLGAAYKQLKDSFLRLKTEFPNLYNEYSQFYFRVCGKKSEPKVITSGERALQRLYPKGTIITEQHIITRVFNANPEILN